MSMWLASSIYYKQKEEGYSFQFKSNIFDIRNYIFFALLFAGACYFDIRYGAGVILLFIVKTIYSFISILFYKEIIFHPSKNDFTLILHLPFKAKPVTTLPISSLSIGRRSATNYVILVSGTNREVSVGQKGTLNKFTAQLESLGITISNE